MCNFRFKATSGSEHGEVLCWASNDLGEQLTPCVFHVMPLGTPQPPRECEVGTRVENAFSTFKAKGLAQPIAKFIGRLS